MFIECLGWLWPAAFIIITSFFFWFLRHQTCPETRAVATRVSGSKWVQSSELDIARNGTLCNLCALAPRGWLFGWPYISSLHSADESQRRRDSFPLLRPYFIGSCHV